MATSTFVRLFTLLLFATAALTLLIGLSRTVYPHDVGQYDASIWAPADLIAHGHSPYFKSIALEPPYVVAPYGPVYYAVIAVGLRIFGDQLWFGRGLSLACLGICALLVYAILRRAAPPSHARRVGLVGVGLLVAQYPVQAFIGTQRPDIAALALALSGLALALADPTTSGKRAPLTGASVGILLALAILVRQTLFLPLLVALAWFALRHDRVRLISAFVAATTTLAAVVGFLIATSYGGFLWHAVRLQTTVPFSAPLALNHFDGFVRAPATLFTLALLATGVVWDWRIARGGRVSEAERPEARLLRRLLLVYLAAAVAVAAVASGKAGSNINYWLEVTVVLSMLTPLAWARSLSAAPASGGARWSTDTIFSSFVAVTFAASLATGAREAHGQLLQWQALPYTNEVVSKLRAITNAGDPVISDYPDIAVSAGRRYYFNDIATYALSPLLSPLLLRVEQSKRIKAIATIAPTSPAGYVPVCLTHVTPTGVYAMRLYVLAAGTHLSKAHCAPA